MNFKIASLTLALGVCAAANASNLIVNGSFEDPARSTWGLSSTIPGWTATTDLIETGHAYIYGVTGQDKEQVLELDANHNATVAQDISGLNLGDKVSLDFLTARRNGVDTSSCLIDVLWNGNLIDTIAPVSTVMSGNSYMLTAQSGINTLAFRGAGRDDSLGGLVDKVCVQAVPEPTSIAVLGLGVLGLVRRRRNRA